MYKLPRFLPVLLLLFTILFHYSCSEDKGNKEYRAVIRVIDGDTFCLEDGTEKGEKVRLIGVDAPESRKTFKKKVGYFGKEAKAFLIDYLTGKRVRLEYDVTPKDRYGRTLAYVYLEDGTFLNAKMVEEGYAQVMTVPPNVKYADQFLELQRQARENNRGLWGK
jgi:micrococcal nuclease